MSKGQNYFMCTWRKAQSIANSYRRAGTKVHVCQLDKHLHVLWFAR